MNQEINIPSTDVLFKDFLFKNKRNQRVLWLSAIVIVLQFGIFKYFYPYASYIHGDSFVYLDTAFLNLDINTYMVGYSRFLRLFSVFSSSDTSLVAFQYLSIQSSSLFLLFTIFYFYKPSKVAQLLLLIFMVFNPLFLHLANLISSDCLFLVLSFIWFTLLLWLLHRPSIKLIIWHSFTLLIAFTFRYNALIYPLISAIAFFLMKLPLYKKITGIALGTLMCGLFILYTSIKYENITGKFQYSPFSGWQLANNAMYAYRFVDSSKRKPVPYKFRSLDNMIREYFDSTRDIRKNPQEALLASTVYMWDPGSPLYKYRNKLFEKDTSAKEFKKWASMGPFYKSYGLHIIKKYPYQFIRYFIWPNSKKYFALPVEFLENYNSGKDDVTLVAQKWFGYKSRKVKIRTKDAKVTVLNFYPILTGTMNFAFLCSLICFIILNQHSKKTIFKKGVILTSIIWFINAGFTICASSAALRFQSFPALLSLTFVVLLFDWMYKISVNPSPRHLLKGIDNWKLKEATNLHV